MSPLSREFGCGFVETMRGGGAISCERACAAVSFVVISSNRYSRAASDAVRAVVITEPGAPVEIRQYSVPEIELGGALLKTLAAEVCGTDVHLWHGRLKGVPYPLIPGHVSVGEILATGGTVMDIDGNPVRPGQTVTFLDVHGTCHHCFQCLVARASTRCPHRRVYGITFGADDGLLGGWSERIYLKPGTLILPLAPHVTAEMWIGGGCGLPTAVHAIELARIRLGDRVLVQGSGPVGISAAALARLSGASWVGVLGAPESRLEAARAFGADWTMDITRTTREERNRAVRAATADRGPDIVIEASGNPNAVSEGCDLVRDAGRYVIVGQYTDNGSIEINPHLQINRKHLKIQGCWGSDYSHLWRAMDVMEMQAQRGGLNWAGLISHRYTLEQAGQALADVEAGKVVKAVVLPDG